MFDIVPSLVITSIHEKNDNVNNYSIANTIKKFEGHPNIAAIREQMKKYNKTFTFQHVRTDEVASIIGKLNAKWLQTLVTYLLR